MEKLFNFDLSQDEVLTIMFLLETALDQLDQASEDDATAIRKTYANFSTQAAAIYVDANIEDIEDAVEEINTLTYGGTTFA